MANNTTNNTTNSIEVEVKAPDLEKATKTLARCAKINTIITVGLTAAAVGLYAAAAVAIKKM